MRIFNPISDFSQEMHPKFHYTRLKKKYTKYTITLTGVQEMTI